MSTKVAVVTGSNQGLGLGIVRGLCKRYPGVVYLTSLYEDQGADAIAALEKEGLHPKYHQLDISNRESVIKFRDHIKEHHGHIDILINNAAISFKRVDPTPLIVQAEETLRVNYFSTLQNCEILFPLLRNGARVVNIASDFGHLSYIPSERIRRKLVDPDLTIAKLSNLMQEFIDRVREGSNEEWGNSPYVVSKAGVIAMTRLHQKELKERGIKVNAVHPGFVRTALAGFRGTLSPDEGADAALYLALEAPDSIQGAFVWWDRRIVDFDGQLPDNPTK